MSYWLADGTLYAGSVYSSKMGVAFYPPIQGQLVTAHFSSLVFQILPEVNGVFRHVFGVQMTPPHVEGVWKPGG